MAALPKTAPDFPPSRMTVAEFLDWPGDGTGARYELIDGEIRAMAPASVTHGIMQANIGSVIYEHLKGTPCRVVSTPGVVPRVRADMNMRVPEIAVNCKPDEPGQRALPDPILIIEILSPSNERETRDNVWAYASIPSIREILLVRSTDMGAELFRRQADDTWPPRPKTIAASAELVLESIEFRAALREFYSDTHLIRDLH